MSKIISGPFIGEISHNSAVIWFETDGQIQLEVSIEPVDGSHGELKVNTISKLKHSGNFPNIAVFDGLKPETEYRLCKILDADSISFKTFPSPPSPDDLNSHGFKFIIGSCATVNTFSHDDAHDEKIFNEMAKEKDICFNLWLGDNIYINDNPEHPENSDSMILNGTRYVPMEFAYNRYKNDRGAQSIKMLLQAFPNFAIWDDHDFGAENSASNVNVNTDEMVELFKAYWPSLPQNETLKADKKPHLFHKFSYADCDFFLLDNRYSRIQTHPEIYHANAYDDYLGEKQLKWLENELRSSNATFKFKFIACGNQMLTTSPAVNERFIKYYGEFNFLIRQIIERYGIKGVVFLSGDIHTSEVMVMTLCNGTKIYEITSSAITGEPKDKMPYNTRQILGIKKPRPDIYSRENNIQNYGLISVSGISGNRKLLFECKGLSGKLFFSYEINQNDFEDSTATASGELFAIQVDREDHDYEGIKYFMEADSNASKIANSGRTLKIFSHKNTLFRAVVTGYSSIESAQEDIRYLDKILGYKCRFFSVINQRIELDDPDELDELRRPKWTEFCTYAAQESCTHITGR